MSRMERPDIEDQIREREEQWAHAVRDKNSEVLYEILAEEFVLVSGSVGVQSREEWLGIIPQYEIEEFRFDDTQIYVYGDAAVAIATYVQRGSWAGQAANLRFYLTDVWVFRDGRWQVVTRHASVVQERLNTTSE